MEKEHNEIKTSLSKTKRIHIMDILKDKEKDFFEAVEKTKDKIDPEGKKLLDVWANENSSNDDGTYTMDEILRGRGITELERKNLDKIKQELIELREIISSLKNSLFEMRKETLNRLQNCQNKLVHQNGKSDKVDKCKELLDSVAAPIEPVSFGIPKVLSGLITIINKSFQEIFSNNCSEEFRQLLINDENNLNKIHEFLKEELKSHDDIRLFDSEYEIFDIDGKIWRNKSYSSTEIMEEIISIIKINLKGLEEKENIEIQAQQEQTTYRY